MMSKTGGQPPYLENYEKAATDIGTATVAYGDFNGNTKNVRNSNGTGSNEV